MSINTVDCGKKELAMSKWLKLRKYRVNRDWYYPSEYWQVECRRLWWPFWVEERGMLSKEGAVELRDLLDG